jgi:hypothetical protein
VATGTQIRDAAVAKRGYAYRVGPTRTTGADGYFDCSGLVVYACRQNGITNFPTVSWLEARFCRDHNTLVSVDTALRTAGTLLFKGANHAYDGFSSGGHVAISMGDGRNVIEAANHTKPVGIYNALGRGWDNAGNIPGVSSGGSPTPPPGTSTGDDEDLFMIAQNKKSKVSGRVCTAKLNVAGRTVDLFNGAAIAYDQPTGDPNVRRWPIGAHAGDGHPHLNGTPLGMAAMADGSGVVVTMSDHGTFVGHWS